VPHTVEVRSTGGTLTHAYFVGGLSRPWNDEARRFLAAQLPLLVRRSGLGAEARVKSILDRSGIDGVLKEIDLLGGDYARRLYFVALVDAARLDAASVQPVLQRVGQRMTSDYERRVVLEHVATRIRLDEKGASAYVQAMATMKSDYDQRLALTALLKDNGQPAGDALLPVLARMKSSYDKRLVLTDIIGRGPLSVEAKTRVLVAAADLPSDYDRGQVLTAYVERFGVEPATRQPFFTAVRSIKSDYERRRVLTDVARKGPVGPDVQQAVFDVVSVMGSDYERAEVLLAFVGGHGIDASTRPAFVSAAEHLKSTYEQNRVLAALVRAEHP
jgi:bla regulator protein blaR1